MYQLKMTETNPLPRQSSQAPVLGAEVLGQHQTLAARPRR